MIRLSKSSIDQRNAILTMLQIMDKFIMQREEQAKLRNREMALPPVSSTPRPCRVGTTLRVPSARRFSFSAKVVIHKNDRYVKGRAIDISASGMFVCVDRKVFREHEKVRLYIRPQGMRKSFKAIATVVRFQAKNGHDGYGLRFSTFSQN